MVSSLIDEDTKTWRRDRLVEIFLPFEVNTILNIPISHHLPEDSIIWVGNKKGIFSVKSAYYVAKKILESDSQGETSRGDVCAPLWKSIWQLNIPEKIRIFAWHLCWNAIPTMVNLNKRGIQVDVLCPICKNEEEDVEHAVLNCELAKAVWSKWRDCPGNFLGIKCDIADMALIIISQGTQLEETEAIVMEKGVSLALELGLEKVILEGDSLQTIQAVRDKDCIAGIIHDLSKFRVAEVRHINRNGNKLAHELAQQAKRDGELKNWTGTTPISAANLLVADNFS
ncbi:hypothetical protein CMV_022679 [Castanea mollissima]|uniref:Reverse transcriptase n=1 Tax=Castanea mollissima TaxID=60419 RepID=A0A8J4QHJ6_9ROSI|nr:hypothetical protein CMV_022679 [Castanea mollissima]